MAKSQGLVLTGGNNGSGNPGTTDYLAVALNSGTVNFGWSYASLDMPTFDFAGYLLNSTFSPLADTDGMSGVGAFTVSAGESFGFRVGTADNTGEPGILTVTSASTSAVPEPATAAMMLVVLGLVSLKRSRRYFRSVPGLLAGLFASLASLAQAQPYSATNVTGQLVLTRTVNVGQAAQTLSIIQSLSVARTEALPVISSRLLPPPASLRTAHAMPPMQGLAVRFGFSGIPFDLSANSAQLNAALATPAMHSFPVSPSGIFGFNGLTHLDQRNANNGNQFSVEPPNPSIAVSSNFILEGVNNAIEVYSLAGTPLLLNVISSNQVFGVSAAINRDTGVNGVFPTDMRVFYDSGIDRWFVVQRVQANDIAGNSLPASQIYVAVSQTGDPTGVYNIYVIDTTDPTRNGCPCLADFPQVGADQYGFYISSNEYSLDIYGNPSRNAIGATILAISKTSLATGAAKPSAYSFVLPSTTGFEFTIQPASTPPGGSNFVASGGIEFFVSSIATGDSNLSVWAMTNTSALSGTSPGPALSRIALPVLPYAVPPNATQKPGPIPYGTSLGISERQIDTSDARILSVTYSGGRLYATLGTLVVDESGNLLAGAAYVVLSPTFRGTLAASAVAQGYLLVKNNNLLRPAIGVNPQGQGGIAVTLVGPDYYPSAAFVPFSTLSAGPAIQLVAQGALPEDGFTGYRNGIARWGDYSTAVAGADGSIWMITEYIPNAPRSQFANWGTFLMNYKP